MEKNTLHIVPHSHWDREWYMSFEQHRMRLVELFDSLIETMENCPDYTYYHMDGQYVVIEDYLEIRPQMRDRLMKLIHENRIQVGPWYVLQDEYLTSGEANVRNMLYGLRLCREIGADPVMSGYFPDAFGNVAQAPQILQGFDIDNAVFGRGIGGILPDNKVDPDSPNNPTELIWRAPDGSEVMGIMFAGWYNNATELPTDREALKTKMDNLLALTRASASTPHLLGMNGCDHQPVQTDLPQALKTARELYGDTVEIKQSNIKDFVDAVRPYKAKFSHIDGEINGQRTAGHVPLIETASAHIPLKQKNHRGQNALERLAEPLSVLARLSGGRDYQDELFYAWKKLMQNHPHDSICCCSCDEVTAEMDTRFEKSHEVARFVQEDAMDAILAKLDTHTLGDYTLTVFHTAPGTTFGTVTAYVDLPENSDASTLHITTANGTPVPCTVKKIGRTFTYTLPKDRFRVPKYVQRFEVTLLSRHEGIGYETYVVHTGEGEKLPRRVHATENGAENELLAFTVESNGSVTLTDKRSGRVYRNNNLFEDVGDGGEEYDFRPLAGDTPITSANAMARRWIEAENDCFVTLGAELTLDLPRGKDGNTRTADTLAHKITVFYTLTADTPRVDIAVKVNNQAENHRLRAHFVPEIQTDRVLAEGQFNVIEREIVPAETWKNPSYSQRMQAFFALFDGKHGLMVATRGLNEYEILRDGKNTMALTLLRCVDQLGDWGYFPTPSAQCKGEHTLCYSLIPFAADTRADAYAEGFAFNGDPLIAKSAAAHAGSLPASRTLFTAQGDFLSFAAFKKAENGNGNILRLYNADSAPHELTLRFAESPKAVAQTNLAETRPTALSVADNTASLTVGAKKIVTLELEF